MTKAKHTSPANILLLMPKFLILLLIPLLRGIVIIFTVSFRAWLEGAWVDVGLVALIFAFILLRWYCVTYVFDDSGISYSDGIFFRKTLCIPMASIRTVTETSHFLLKPLHVVELRADTAAGTVGKNEFCLLVKDSEAAELFSEAIGFISADDKLHCSRGTSVLLLSLITSNSFAGLLLLVTFISQLGELAGRELSVYFVNTLNNLSRALAFGIPPAAAAVGYLLLLSWVLAFFAEFIRNKNFTLSRSKSGLTVSRGIFTNRRFAISTEAVSFLDIRQTLFSKLWGYCAVFVHAIGFAPKVRDNAVIIPAMKRSEAVELAARVLPEFPITSRQLKPNYGSLFRFIMDPLYACLGIPAAAVLLIYFLPLWKSFVLFVAFMAMLPSLWFLAVRLADYFTAGISRKGDVFTMRYSDGFYLHTVVFPLSKIVSISTRQSIFQMTDHRCDLFVKTYSQGRTVHRCRNLHREELLQFFGTDFILKQH